MSLPGLPSINDLIAGARDLCKINETFAHGTHITALGGLFSIDTWPGTQRTTWYINASKSNIDPCDYQACLRDAGRIRTETRGPNVPSFPPFNACCPLVPGKCCIDASPANLAAFKSALKGIVGIFEQYISGIGSGDFREGIRSAFTNTCEAITKAIGIVNAKLAATGQPLLDPTDYNTRCRVRAELDRSFPPPDGLIPIITNLINEYNAIINGQLAPWVIFCDCCDCEKADKSFPKPAGTSKLTPNKFCNEPLAGCEGNTCAQGGGGGTESLPGLGASEPYKPADLDIANWNPCKHSVNGGILPAKLPCQTNIVGTCDDAVAMVYTGNATCTSDYTKTYSATMDVTNCCAKCKCSDYGMADAGDTGFITNCTNRRGTIEPKIQPIPVQCYTPSPLNCISCVEDCTCEAMCPGLQSEPPQCNPGQYPVVQECYPTPQCLDPNIGYQEQSRTCYTGACVACDCEGRGYPPVSCDPATQNSVLVPVILPSECTEGTTLYIQCEICEPKTATKSSMPWSA
jgi:hypothetical protein